MAIAEVRKAPQAGRSTSIKQPQAPSAPSKQLKETTGPSPTPCSACTAQQMTMHDGGSSPKLNTMISTPYSYHRFMIPLMHGYMMYNKNPHAFNGAHCTY